MYITEDEIKEISNPISEQKPCGEFIRLDRTKYRSLRNSFNQARTSMKKIIDTPDELNNSQLIEDNISNWENLSALCFHALQNTKDIELMSWLVSSQLIIDKSLTSFSLSIQFLKDNIVNYWESIYPLFISDTTKDLEEDEAILETINIRIKALSQLFGESKGNGMLFLPLRLTPLFDDVTLTHYIKNNTSNQRDTIKSKVLSTLTKNKNKLNLTEIKINNLQLSIDAIIELKTFIGEKTNDHSITLPAFSSVIEELVEAKTALEFLADIQPIEKTPQPENNDESEYSDKSNSLIETQNSNISNIHNREQAFNQIRIIAHYFRINEPHSPVSFLLDKSIRWGELSLPELLDELYRDGKASLNDIFNLAGLNTNYISETSKDDNQSE
ncbi:type VI secretion system ImpA family N-terminal domain-containing protein [uncultured Shewanella sp.]|uniref:type VI secretion system protein TssA n=1 Tax=uncultured Shewanella sp. TaxID=173975 RepID=UPI002613E620|nr:type VI secretion system ImpA family N-terminal domain-containing protein [uncultured Shewanella sp.]